MITMTGVAEILQTIGGGGLAAIVLVGGFIMWKMYPGWLKNRDREMKAREHENMLRKVQIRLLNSLMKFLEAQGHDIDIPDITEEL